MSNIERLREKSIYGRVAVYVRSAVDDQTNSACEHQVQAAHQVVDQTGSVKVYMDAACSGMDPHRPGLRRLLEDARRGEINCLIVRDLSRLARDYSLLTNILGELQAAGVEVVTIG